MRFIGNLNLRGALMLIADISELHDTKAVSDMRALVTIAPPI